MCYDVKAKLESQLKRAKHYNYTDLIKDLEDKLTPYLLEDIHHASGFIHPKMLVYTNEEPNIPVVSTWGLVPFWVKNKEQQQKIWNNTINARGETIFEKPSFRQSAGQKHCLVYLDGFYEHHHFKGKTYPFHIRRADNEPMAIAGLWEEWVDKSTGEILHTFTIVTTKGNALLSKIHNNPKLNEPRMPLILEEDEAEEWLKAGSKETVLKLIKPNIEASLKAHAVRPLRGKKATGNNPLAFEPFKYDELGKVV